MTKIKKVLGIFVVIQGMTLMLLVLSQEIYINFLVAQISSMGIVMGSLYAYRSMIERRVTDVDPEDNKDIIDMMDDPYDLYEEERENEVADLKAMIKAEKAKQGKNLLKNTTQNGSAWVSAYRMIPYAVLVLGFISLENNGLLFIMPYLIGLAVGIGSGYWMGKELFISRSSEY